VRVNQEGTTVRLPVNPSHGTVVLPALPAELKAAAGAGAHAAPHAVWPPAQAARAAQAQNGVPAPQNAQPPPSQLPAAQPRAIQPQAAQQQGAQVVPINRAAQMAAPTTPIARTPPSSVAPTTPISPTPQSSPQSQQQRPAAAQSYPAPPQQRTSGPGSSPVNGARPQGGQYPMAYQNAPRPVQQSAQYRPPQQQPYQAPRTQAPRKPQSYSPNAPAKQAGLSCMSKLAILVIVLAVAVAVGVTVGRQFARHNTNTGSAIFGTNRVTRSIGLADHAGYDN
jgi:hypothetical protein